MSKNIDLVSLRLFAYVAKTGRFAEAARHFELPPSSVSRRIAQLEQTLQHKLLYRHTRAMRLTDVGETYYRQVREVLDMLDSATEQVSGAAHHPQGTLHINAPVAFGHLQLMPALASFQLAYPDIDVELTLTDAVIDPVQEGADVVIRIGSLGDSSLVARRLGIQESVVCATAGYLERHGIPDTPMALQTHNCLLYKGTSGTKPWYFRDRTPSQAREQSRRLAPFKHIEVQGNLSSNNAESLVKAALQDQGMVLFPTWLILAQLQAGTLTPVLTDWEVAGEPGTQEINLIYPENKLRSPKVAVFIDHLLSQAKQLVGQSDQRWAGIHFHPSESRLFIESGSASSEV